MAPRATRTIRVDLDVYRRLKAIRDELRTAGDGMATMNDALRKVLALADAD